MKNELLASFIAILGTISMASGIFFTPAIIPLALKLDPFFSILFGASVSCIIYSKARLSLLEENFFEKIIKFNDMYKLDNKDKPIETFNELERIKNFYNIIQEEIEEGRELIKKIENGVDRIEYLTDLSDWLGDIIVYCASEARRYGIPMEQVLDIIMESNFSKLGSDGKPIYDERGKVMKGPGYWKPEPEIRKMLEKRECK